MYALLIVYHSLLSGNMSYIDRHFNNKEDCEKVAAIYREQDKNYKYICLLESATPEGK